VAADEQLARVLGPDWQTLRGSQLADRAHRLEQAASFANTLVRYMAERLQALVSGASPRR
jgi:hypothetical protein